MQTRKIQVTIDGNLFEHISLNDDTTDQSWVFKANGRVLVFSSSIISSSAELALLGAIENPERVFVTEHLLPDEDFDMMRLEKLACLDAESALHCRVNCMTLATPPIFYLPLDKRLAGQSVSDFLKFFQLEQVEGVMGYTHIIGRKLEKLLSKIAPEEFERYELEWKLKDAIHEIYSPLLSVVRKEAGKAFQELVGGRIPKAELLPKEKNLMRLRMELKDFLLNHMDALKELYQALERVLNREPWAEDLYLSVLSLSAIYEEVLQERDSSPSNWVKLSLLMNFLEREEAASALVTSPKKLRLQAPYLLRAAYEGIAGKYTRRELLSGILGIDTYASALHEKQLHGEKKIEPGSESFVFALQRAFYGQTRLFSKEMFPIKKPGSVIDPGVLALMPAHYDDKEGPVQLVRAVPSSPTKFTLTDAGEMAFNF